MTQCPMGAFPYTVLPGDTLWPITQRYNVTANEIAAINPGVDLNNLYGGQIICILPKYKYIKDVFMKIGKLPHVCYRFTTLYDPF